jgi:PKD repeat protein
MADSTSPAAHEQQQQRAEEQRRRARRRFLKRAAGGTAAGGVLLAGCDTTGSGGAEQPTPRFVHSADGTDPLRITFNATGSENDDITSYEWEFGDGASKTTTGPQVTHTYTDGGSYDVRLRVTNQEGVSAQTDEQINVGVAASQTVTIDFSNDFGVLNFAFALEQLEGAFYARVVSALNGGGLSFDNDETAQYFRDLNAHEAIHRITLQTALADNAIPSITPAFGSIDFSSADSVITTARVLEDTGVSAYNGAADMLEDPTFLTIAGKIVSVEARHASAIRATIDPQSENFADLTDLTDFGAQPDVAYDAALPPSDVLAAAGGFISTEIQATGL